MKTAADRRHHGRIGGQRLQPRHDPIGIDRDLAARKFERGNLNLSGNGQEFGAIVIVDLDHLIFQSLEFEDFANLGAQRARTNWNRRDFMWLSERGESSICAIVVAFITPKLL